MNVVDSSAWLEYFADGPRADFFAPAIEKPTNLLVPSVTLYEVFKRLSQQRSENHALQAMGLMAQSPIIHLDASLAIIAARLSIELRLPMADSIVLATARVHRATLWTMDADFMGMQGVRYRSHRQGSEPDGSGRIREATRRKQARKTRARARIGARPRPKAR